MEIYPFVTYLSHLMVRETTSKDLKDQLDKDLNEIKFNTERIKYLEAIKKLWWSRDLTTFRRGEISDFIHYIEFKSLVSTKN